MKMFVWVLLAVLAVVFISSSAIAVEIPPADQISNNLIKDYGSWSNNKRSTEFEISYTSYGIEKTSSTSVFVSGTTETNQTAGRFGVLITVQQWDNNRWNNYKSTSDREYSSTKCSHSDTITVASGYYYRIKVTHTATDNFVDRTLYSYSKSIFVN